MTDNRRPEDATGRQAPNRDGPAARGTHPAGDPTSHVTLEAGPSPIAPQPTMQATRTDDVPPEPESIAAERTAGRPTSLLLAVGILIGVILYFLLR
jgi:hypothetical protein